MVGSLVGTSGVTVGSGDGAGAVGAPVADGVDVGLLLVSIATTVIMAFMLWCGAQ